MASVLIVGENPEKRSDMLVQVVRAGHDVYSMSKAHIAIISIANATRNIALAIIDLDIPGACGVVYAATQAGIPRVIVHGDARGEEIPENVEYVENLDHEGIYRHVILALIAGPDAANGDAAEALARISVYPSSPPGGSN
jgi:hypothetical protein